MAGGGSRSTSRTRSTPLQPDQEKRYRLRAAREMDRGDYQAFEVLLCAPAAYARTHPEAEGFDRVVTYEEVAVSLRAADPSPRGAYRANFVATAAMRNANTWKRVGDDATNAFWGAAYAIAADDFPILERKPIVVTKGSPCIEIRPRDFTGMPKTYVLLKGDRGFVDVTFTGSASGPFAGDVAGMLGAGMTVRPNGGSAAIRLEVEPFWPFEPLDEGLPKVRRAFAACARLVEFYRSHRVALEHAARSAIPKGRGL